MNRILQISIVAMVLGLASFAGAQVTPDDAKCRAAIHKNASKVSKAANRAIDACIKAQLAAPTGAECNDATPGNPTTDGKGKIAGAATRLATGVGAACSSNPAVLAEFPRCPSPANADDDGGASTGVDDFAELGACEIALNTARIATVRNYILAPDSAAIVAHGNAKAISKCANAIAKSASKLWSAISKHRGKCQTTSDKAAGPYDYVCSTDDGGGKVTTAVGKAEAAIQKACGDTGLTSLELALIHTCATDVAAIQQCVTNSVMSNASGITATAFEFAGVCPTEVEVALNAGTAPGTIGRLTDTRVEIGWRNPGNSEDVNDGTAARVSLSCSSADCESCSLAPDMDCSAGNCRCSATLTCDEPFTQDNCTGTCALHLGPPLPLNAGGSPLCLVNSITQAFVGSANVGTGSSTTELDVIARLHIGITHSRPCPTCSAVTIGGIGTCNGGANNMGPCVTHAVHPDFGPTSHDCQPSPGSNVSGTGGKLGVTLTDGNISLPFGDACDPPHGSLMCACGACSGNNNVACNSDTECSDAGLGVCYKGSNGSDREPNNCADSTCEDIGDEQGRCTGESTLYCESYVRRSGDGLLTCATNSDCEAVDLECPGNDCGTCSLAQTKTCYLDPIEATGLLGSDGAELVSVFCAPSMAGSVGKNLAFGLPGAVRLLSDWDFTAYCPDGTTPWELGGSNCP